MRRLVAAVPAGSRLVPAHPTPELGGAGGAEAMRFWDENATAPILEATSHPHCQSSMDVITCLTRV